MVNNYIRNDNKLITLNATSSKTKGVRFWEMSPKRLQKFQTQESFAGLSFGIYLTPRQP